MPARKSNASMASNIDEPVPKSTPAKDDGLSVEDLSLPRTMVQRLAKGVLPPNTQIQKDALLALSKSATVFVNYLTNSANENTLRSNKKTVQPKDVLDALKELEFEAFLPRLEAELNKYNYIQCEKRNSYRKKVREEKKAQKQPSGHDASGIADTTLNGDHGDSPRVAKRARMESGAEEERVEESEDDGAEDHGEEDHGEEEQLEQDGDEDDDEDEAGPENIEDLTEDPLEVREEAEEASDGDESD